MAKLSFKPKQVTKDLLGALRDRSLDVVSSRFGLKTDAQRKTLEAIGQKYGITRERVRQIENSALNSIRKSDEFESAQMHFDELKTMIHELGGAVNEEELLEALADDQATQNHLYFLLVLGDHFKLHKENEFFKTRWTTDNQILTNVHDALQNLYKNLKDDEIMTEAEIVDKLLQQIKDINEEHRDLEIAKRWLRISKKVSPNPLNEWGKSHSKNVKVRGVKDYAFLVMRKHGNPMHFREVAEAITELFGKKTHPATTHNELIKDSRFVLVGRGKYGLREWGYKPGVVRDVIKEILEKYGPLTRDEIVDHVMKERFLKRNTILVNLQNPQYFTRLEDGRYTAI
jgi:hypothetical protein